MVNTSFMKVSMYHYLRKRSRWQTKKNRPQKAGFHLLIQDIMTLPLILQSWFKKSIDSCVLNGDDECQVIGTRSSWLNCGLCDDEAVYCVSIGHHEAVAVGNG